MGLLIKEETGSLIFLINFWDCIDFWENLVSSNLLLVTVPLKETYIEFEIFALLLESLILLISTFLTKYSPSLKSNLFSPSPATYVIFSPVNNPWLGIFISMLSVKEPEKVISVSLISNASSK